MKPTYCQLLTSFHRNQMFVDVFIECVAWFFLINLICFADNLNTLLLIFCSLVSFWPYYFIFFLLKYAFDSSWKYYDIYRCIWTYIFFIYWIFIKKPFQKEKPWWPTFFQDLGLQTIILLLCPWPHKVGNDLGHFSYFTAYLKQ